MLEGYAVLLVPLAVFVLFGAGAIWLYFATREFMREALDSSRGARFLYVTIAVIVLPLVLGGWSDIVDVSEVLQGHLQANNAAPLSILAFLLVVYLYLHGCWFDREEHGLVTRKNELGRITELDCQKNYLVRLLENFRACIGRYAERLRSVLDGQSIELPISQRLPENLARDNVRMIIESIRQAYKSVETVPKDYGVKVLLLESQDGYLVHRESYDGTDWDCFKNDCESHRTQYFNLANPSGSVAVASAVSGTIQIIECCEDCHRDDSHPFWYFQDCLAHQKQELGSMVVIPFEPNSGHKFVLCITCSQPYAFLRKHLWKAKAVQENIQARLALLFCQTALLDSLRAESTDYRGRIDDLECGIAAYERERAEVDARLHELTDELEHSRRVQDDLTNELEKTKIEKDKLDKDLKKALDSHGRVVQQLNALRLQHDGSVPSLTEMRTNSTEPDSKSSRRRSKNVDGKGEAK